MPCWAGGCGDLGEFEGLLEINSSEIWRRGGCVAL